MRSLVADHIPREHLPHLVRNVLMDKPREKSPGRCPRTPQAGTLSGFYGCTQDLPQEWDSPPRPPLGRLRVDSRAMGGRRDGAGVLSSPGLKSPGNEKEGRTHPRTKRGGVRGVNSFAPDPCNE